ncbi:MAG: hypothetical protein AAGK37_13410 [Pseudomonadota bacterium]
MIDKDDVRAAVAAGILDETQGARLIALSDSRRGARDQLAPGDEPFELFKGFNEVFIVVGLIILAMGWTAVIGAMAGSAVRDLASFGTNMAAVSAAVLWLLSEYFIRRRRMVAPAITLTLFWAANAVTGSMAAFSEPFMIGQGDWTSMATPFALSTGIVLLQWWRFRVPIGLSVAVLGLFAALATATLRPETQPDTLREFFLLSGEGPIPWITLGLGLGVFVLAMAFDMSDPHRVTRRAANGFWLHILAAPAIVNTVALTLLSGNASYVLLVLFLALVAIVAIVIDRRSFLIAGVGYAVAMATAISGAEGAAWTIFALGAALVLTGAFWEVIRARLLRLLGPALPLDRLPPSG